MTFQNQKMDKVQISNYLFTRCEGITPGAAGNLTVKGCLIIFQARADDHRVLAEIESRLKKAASLFLRSLNAAEE